MKFRIILSLFFLGLLISCNTNKNIAGRYRSNFADLGFFITEIELKAGNRFHYQFSGDLQNTELDGNYKIIEKTLYLRFDKLKNETDKDAIKIIGNDTIIDFSKLTNTHSYELITENDIEFHRKYRIEKNKLLSYRIGTDTIVKKAKIYTNRRKYIVFGPKSYMKKRYLKKIS